MANGTKNTEPKIPNAINAIDVCGKGEQPYIASGPALYGSPAFGPIRLYPMSLPAQHRENEAIQEKDNGKAGYRKQGGYDSPGFYFVSPIIRLGIVDNLARIAKP